MVCFGLRDTHIGIDFPGFEHTVGKWAAEGLIAIFSFLVGLEHKVAFVDGTLRNIKKAVLLIVAAFGGVVVPALIRVADNVLNEGTCPPWTAGRSPRPPTSPLGSPCSP